MMLWTIALFCGFSDFFMSHRKYSPRLQRKFTYCEFVDMTKYQVEYTIFAIAGICLVIMSMAYTTMFCAIRRRPNLGGAVRQQMDRNKKALLTTLLILGTFIICWGPNCLYQVTLVIMVKFNRQAIRRYTKILSTIDPYLFDLLLVNCLLDPIIYAIRMREVQAGYRKLFSICCKGGNSHSSPYRFSAATTRSTIIMRDRRKSTLQNEQLTKLTTDSYL